jgi:hypothetical protein
MYVVHKLPRHSLLASYGCMVHALMLFCVCQFSWNIYCWTALHADRLYRISLVLLNKVWLFLDRFSRTSQLLDCCGHTHLIFFSSLMKNVENIGRILIMPLHIAFTAPVFMKLRSYSSAERERESARARARVCVCVCEFIYTLKEVGLLLTLLSWNAGLIGE